MIILDFIQKGGIFMWPLFITALAAIYLIIYKSIQLVPLYFRYSKRLNLLKVRDALKDQRYIDAQEEIQGYGPVERILDKGLTYIRDGYDEIAIKDRLEMIYEEELHILDRGLSVILVLGEIMPMLGLLGTVSGMIQVFKAISIYGTGDANALASGISEALLTTETGLVLAIPTMFIYTILNSQIEKNAKLMRQAGATIVTCLRVIKKKNGKNV
jgi:biopolymer transport protein ExbB